QALDITIPGQPMIRMQWLDPSYIDIIVPGQDTVRLTVPGSAGADGTSRGPLPKPTTADNAQSLDDRLLRQSIAQLGLRQSADYAYLYYLGDVSYDDYQMFTPYLNAVAASDPNLFETFVQNGWKIVLTPIDLNGLLFGGNADGVEGATYFPDKTIYIHTGEYSYCVVHEMGHFLDYVRGFVSDSGSFANLYYAEGANLTSYGRSSTAEFFAEVFSYLVLDPNTAYARCPQTSAFVQAYRY
ncbi:MAG: hypothetical protein IJT32_04990, partial [Lachnospiraceae bacterium]|nr:hypothetical protein [Lachnospiraceae bacterium]